MPNRVSNAAPLFPSTFRALEGWPWRAPLSVSDASRTDHENWVSFPPHYPHIVRLTEGGEQFQAIRMRTASGRLQLVGDPSTCKQEITRRLELLWIELGLAHKIYGRRFDEDADQERFEKLFEAVENSHVAALSRSSDMSWPSPLALMHVPYKRGDEDGSEMFTMGCPIIRVSPPYVEDGGFEMFVAGSIEFYYVEHSPAPDTLWPMQQARDRLSRGVYYHSLRRDELVKKARAIHEAYCEERGITPSLRVPDEEPVDVTFPDAAFSSWRP